MLSDLLKQKNVPDTLVILPNGGHGGENTPHGSFGKGKCGNV